jgi:CheY-like chemotaxis protein
VSGSPLVLVVDDDSGIRDSLGDCLRAEGYRVSSARDGAEGLERIQDERPGLVLVDLFMPVMDGHQLLARLRGDAATREIPVVLMTGATPRAGDPLPPADAVLPKPFELDELLAVIRRLAAHLSR